VRFGQHNILGRHHPGRIPFDLVLCRNVLLYFDRQVRTDAFARLSGAVMPDGFLMLGAGETAVGQTDRFVPAARRASFFEPVTALQPAMLRRSA
jgi:chemotaxis protein methyltransferase CheR